MNFGWFFFVSSSQTCSYCFNDLCVKFGTATFENAAMVKIMNFDLSGSRGTCWDKNGEIQCDKCPIGSYGVGCRWVASVVLF